MSSYTLRYFDFPGGRGEACRLAFYVAGVDFNDDRIKTADWPQHKPSTPFGAMPVLVVEGKGNLSQSNAILNLIGHRHNLLPTDDVKAAQHLAVMEAVEDLAARFNPSRSMTDENEKKRAREELASGYMKSWAINVDKLIAGPFFGGSDLSVADLKLYVYLKALKKGVMDYIPTTYFDDFQKISGLYNAVAAHKKVVQWYAMTTSSST